MFIPDAAVASRTARRVAPPGGFAGAAAAYEGARVIGRLLSVGLVWRESVTSAKALVIQTRGQLIIAMLHRGAGDRQTLHRGSIRFTLKSLMTGI
jgi:hypothetical protein